MLSQYHYYSYIITTIIIYRHVQISSQGSVFLIVSNFSLTSWFESGFQARSTHKIESLLINKSPFPFSSLPFIYLRNQMFYRIFHFLDFGGNTLVLCLNVFLCVFCKSIIKGRSLVKFSFFFFLCKDTN